MVKLSPLPLPCPLLSVTLPRRQLFPLLGDDVGLKSGAPATQKARFGQNRVRGGASVKRKRSHRTPVYWRRRKRGCMREGGGNGETGLHTKEVSVFMCLAPGLDSPSLPVCSGPVREHGRCSLGSFLTTSYCQHLKHVRSMICSAAPQSGTQHARSPSCCHRRRTWTPRLSVAFYEWTSFPSG